MQVYDCFQFFDELDLLEIRLNTLAPYVHKFVLVEATHTFSGKEKSLYYEENKDDLRFAKFKNKIVHIIHDEPPDTTEWLSGKERRKRNDSQRNAIISGLKNIEPDDIIIVSDADEIINPNILPTINIDKPYRLKHNFYYYYFNCKVNELYAAAFICLGKNIKRAKSISAINRRNLPAYPATNTGWHFSWLKETSGEIADKMESFCHAEYDTEYFKDEKRIQDCIDNNRDLFDREHMKYEIVPLDVPQYVQDNMIRFLKYVRPEPRVYDCFMFFNELDLLELRLHALYDVVDKFVLVESAFTHSGKPKKLYFNEAKHQPRFQHFLPKIEHVVVEELYRDVSTFTNEQDQRNAAFENEWDQRNAMIKGIPDLAPYDIVLISDVDEIPNKDIFSLNIDRPYHLQMKFYYYYVNMQLDHFGSTAMICLGKDIFEAGGTQAIRKMEYTSPEIKNAGWHYSYLGSPKQLVEKIEALAHLENDKEEFKQIDYIKERIENNEDLFGRSLNLTLSPVEGPDYLRLSNSRFGKYIKTTTMNRISLRLLEGKKDLIGAEIGVHFGSNAINMLRHLDIKKLYLIDPYNATCHLNTEDKFREEEAHESLAEYSDKIIWIKKTAEEAVSEVEDELDFVYVDGDHSYDFVKKDIELYYPKVKIGGLYAGHDYSYSPVKQAVDEAFGRKLLYGYNLDGAATDWWIVKGRERIVEKRISILEQDVAMGVFTHRTTYLSSLLNSVQKFLPHIQMIVKVADGSIIENMERLRQDFLRTDKRFWVFLDDDIQFLDSDIVYKAITNLVTNKLGAIGVYSTFDPDYQLGSDLLEYQEVGWIPGYFMMVDSHKVGHVHPDKDLPHGNTAIDTTYSIGVRLAGYKLGLSPSIVYHAYKAVPIHTTAYDLTNDYLLDKYGDYYFEHVRPIPNIVGGLP